MPGQGRFGYLLLVCAIKQLSQTIKKEKRVILFLLFWLGWYLFFQLKTIYGGDSGDLVASAITRGIPHPPGYSFYTFLASLLVKLPFFTPSWRVGLLSSIPSAITLTFLFIIIKKITKNTYVSLLATILLGFNYIFWLYSEVPEVFSLNNLLAVLLIYLVLEISQIRLITQIWRIYLFAFILGIVVCHHHTIAFLFPGFFYLLKQKQKIFKQVKLSDWLKITGCFLLGLAPLLYLPIVSQKMPAIDWGGVTNLNNFLRLLFRVDYGTFYSSTNPGNFFLLRLASIFFLGNFIVKDFWWLGILLLFLGLVYLRQKNKPLFWFFLIELISLIFFIFYASFVLVNDLMVATFERFMLLPYLIITILLACGLVFVLSLVSRRFSQLTIIFKCIILIYPLTMLVSNFPKISILKNDLTAEHLAQDILDTLPQNSILLLATDTPLFDTQYYYYAYSYRPDIKAIHFFKLYKDYYSQTLKKFYPDLILPDQDIKGKAYVNKFLELNQDKLPIFTTAGDLTDIKGQWLPAGLLSRYYSGKDSTPSADLVIRENQKLWQQYHSPLEGSLKYFKNLYLVDILRVYSEAHFRLAVFALEQDFLKEAKEHFEEVIKLNPKDSEAYLGLGRIYLNQKDCGQAESNFKKVLEFNSKDVLGLAFLRKTFLECYQNEQKAKEFEDSCVEQEQKQQLKLQDL